jgi:hypothetical protein
MSLHLRQFRTGAARRRDFSLLGALVIFLCVYASIAAGFFWLMQPSSVPNSGVAAYRPPPATIVNYVDAPPSAVAVAPSPDRFIARTSLDQPAPAAGPLPEVVETPVVEPKKETKKVATRTAPRRETQPREPREQRNAGWDRNSNWGSGWGSNWNYASQSRGGSRPWF